MQNLEKSFISTNVIMTFTICIFITLVLPPIEIYIPQPLRYAIFLLSIVVTGLGMIDGNARFVSENILIFAVIMLLGILNYPKWAVYQTFVKYMFYIFFFFMPLLWERYGSKFPERYKLVIKNLFIIVSLVTILTTIIGQNIFPQSARILSTGVEMFTAEEKTIYTKYNIGGYDFSYAMVLLLPFFIYGFKNENKAFYLLCTLAVIYLAVKTQYMIAVILCILEIILCVSDFLKSHLFAWLIWLIALSVLAVLGYFYIDKISEFFFEKGFAVVSSRLTEISHFLHNGAWLGDLESRFYLYQSSLKTFFRHPLFGAGLFSPEDLELGRHSEILDLMGCSGLVGLACFAFLMRVHWKLITRRKDSPIYKYCKISFFAFICFSLVDPSFKTYIGFILFMSPILFDKSTTKLNLPVCHTIKVF